MYLKSLQVVGFKSFADRTTLVFHPGVTAIVGPNGCGKSNVLDAIRWVLGEQSAKALRGGAMQDVIFNGTDKRKPTGMAEVALTFGDCEASLGVEYNEVTICRRVFKDGGGEYELNKQPSRLKDIQQLFMDTGIGRTAYSIMEQGKIDQILSSRPEDRRAIFEEAAGITKYKSQKKEALRKLENTEANLIRVDDIVREVKRQIGSLQRQAAKAKRYQTGKEELLSMESKLARHQYDIHSVGIDTLKSEAEAARAAHEELTVKLEAEELALLETKHKLQDADAEVSRLRDIVDEHRNTINRAEMAIRGNEARIEDFTELRNRAESETTAAIERIEQQESQLKQLDEQIATSDARGHDLENEVASKQEELQTLRSRISSLEGERGQQENRRASLERQGMQAREQLAALELQQKNFLFRAETLQNEEQGVGVRLEEARQVAAMSSEELATAQSRLNEARENVATLRAREQEEAAALRTAEEEHAGMLKRFQSLQAKVEALRHLAESHAGTPAGAQNILKAVQSGELQAELLGTLSDHLKVKTGYEAPVALLLGEAINCLLIRDHASVTKVLLHLRAGGDAKKQHCALLPLDLARPIPPASASPTLSAQHVECDELTRPLIDALLADSHIVESLEEAVALKRVQPHSTIVTRSGELLTRAGILAIGKAEGNATLIILERQAEIERLQGELTALEAEVKAADDLRREASATREGGRDRTADAQQELQAAEVAAATLRSEQAGLERAATDLERQHEAAQKELQRLHSQEQVDHEKTAQLHEAVQQQEKEREEIGSTIEALNRQIDELSTEELETDELLTTHRIQFATHQQQAQNWQQQREPLAQRLAEQRNIVATRSRESQDYDAKIIQAREAIAVAEGDHALGAEQLAVTQEQRTQKESERAVFASIIEAKDVELRAAHKRQQELHEIRSNRELKLAEKNLFLDNLRERMRRDYQLELEDLPALTPEDEGANWSAIETDVRERRGALDAMGPVNLDAIAEYDELEERNKFLESQQADLVSAKTQILEAIAQINLTTQTLFAETFEKVKVNFQDMFNELFGGGKATISLQDSNDPLECGIDILARPPGKQPQVITLLSGGERTMTAVALLFAIYMVKPSPFCVLDEMDAPLDESNINRFIKMLQRFVTQSQFIVITHNKRTISVADVLYGVTMEERGVSKVVSVRLSKQATPALAAVAEPTEANGKPATEGEDNAEPSEPASGNTPARASMPEIIEESAIPSIAETFGSHA